jgi:hypothetical protein
MKKIIRLTESDLSRIVKKVIQEQTEEVDYIKAIQRFLNEKLKLNLEIDGRTGPNSQTADAIRKYQEILKVTPDGVWGPETMEQMPIEEKKKLKKLIAEEGGIFEKFLNWMGWD